MWLTSSLTFFSLAMGKVNFGKSEFGVLLVGYIWHPKWYISDQNFKSYFQFRKLYPGRVARTSCACTHTCNGDYLNFAL